MKRSSAALALSLLLLLPATAAASSVEEATLSLGWLAENAPLVVRVEVTSVLPRQAEVRVLARLKGPPETPAVLRIGFREEEAPRLSAGERALLFLAPPRREGGRLHRLVGPAAVVPLSPETAERIGTWVSTHLRVTGEEGTAGALRAHLAAGAADRIPRISYSAALDLARLADRLGLFAREETEAVVEAFASCPFGTARKRALARAAGVPRSETAVGPLVASLLTGRGRAIRGAVGDALGRIGSPKAVAALAAGLSQEEEGIRADVVNALGRLGLEAGVEVLAGALRDPAPSVRVEAALALGEVARAVRRRERRSIEALDALERAFGAAEELGERKAILWAAAQLDTRDGYELVREAARDARDQALRRFAERTLANPRRRLVLAK